MAWRDRAVAPATNSRKTNLSLDRVVRALIVRRVLFVFTRVRLG